MTQKISLNILERLLTLVIGIFIAYNVSAEGDTGIKFEHSLTWQAVKDKAKAENKIIFVDAYTTWCGPCKMMAAKIFTNPDVASYYNASFVNAKIDMEKGEGIAFAQNYTVNAFPTLLFIDGEGNMVHRDCGSRDADAFIALGKEALNPATQLSGYIKRYQGGERAPAFLLDYIKKMQSANLPATAAVDAYFKDNGNKASDTKEGFQIFMDGVEDFRNPAFAYQVAKFESTPTDRKADLKSKIESAYLNSLVRAARLDKKIPGTLATTKTEIKAQKYVDVKKVMLKSDIEIADLQKNWPAFGKAAVAYYGEGKGFEPNELNSISWKVFEKISDKAVINKAVKWAAEACKKDANYPYLDTYASILYKAGNKNLAKEKALEAIKTGKDASEDVSGTEALLQKIDELP